MIEEGKPAPDFELSTDTGETVRLSDLRGKPVVLYFYPKDDTPGCTAQACGIRDAYAEFEAAGAVVLGVSPDPVAKLARFAAAESLTYPLASDVDREVLEAYGAWGEKTLYGKVVTSVIRSTVVVGPDGLVTHALYNVRATGHVGRLQRELGIA